MKMIKWPINVTAILSVIFSIAICSCNQDSKNAKHAYILTQKLFDNYEGTKEYKKKISVMEISQKNLLDSLSLNIKLMEGRFSEKSPELLLKKEQYRQLYQQVSDRNEEAVERYNEQLWKQINQYIEEYGKTKGYGFIYGANGSGTLMFADTTYNITNDVTEYINEKYAGK